jgi:hypothetical protein
MVFANILYVAFLIAAFGFLVAFPVWLLTVATSERLIYRAQNALPRIRSAFGYIRSGDLSESQFSDLGKWSATIVGTVGRIISSGGIVASVANLVSSASPIDASWIEWTKGQGLAMACFGFGFVVFKDVASIVFEKPRLV